MLHACRVLIATVISSLSLVSCAASRPPTPAIPVIPVPVAANDGPTISGPHGDYRQVILRTIPDPVPCDGHIRHVSWTAPRPALIRSVTVWIGTTWAFPDTPATRPLLDVRSTIFLPDGFVVAYLGLDHYAAFTGLSQIEKRFDPPLPIRDPLILEHYCANYGASMAHSATNVLIDWILPDAPIVPRD